MWDLIVSVPDHCLSFYFSCSCNPKKVTNREKQSIIFHAKAFYVK